MSLSQKNLIELKEKLSREKEELEKNLNRIAKPVNPREGDYETSFDEIGSDKEDNATEVEQYSQNLPVETALEKKLQEVLDALGRIDQKTYGLCENCQKEIPLERLMANPSARTCIKC